MGQASLLSWLLDGPPHARGVGSRHSPATSRTWTGREGCVVVLHQHGSCKRRVKPLPMPSPPRPGPCLLSESFTHSLSGKITSDQSRPRAAGRPPLWKPGTEGTRGATRGLEGSPVPGLPL